MATQWLKNLSHKAAHVKMLNPVYNASLGRPNDPLRFHNFPHDLFSADAGRGRWVASGQLDIAGHRVSLDGQNWFIGTREQDTPYFDKLHGFDILLELKSLGGDVGRRAAREITDQWLNHFQAYHHIIWEVDLTARRLVNWMIAYPFAFEAAPDAFLDKLHLCLYRQYHHLLNILAAPNPINAFDRYALLWAVVIAECHCVDFYDELLFSSHLQLLKNAVEEVSLDDGGMIGRNPQNLIEMAQSLILLRHSFVQFSQTPPLWLTKRIETLSRLINGLTLSDHDFPQFQGVALPCKKQISDTVKQSGLRLRRGNMHCEPSGFTALRNGRTAVMIDHGLDGSHNAPFAFEMSHGAARIIVSCGTHVTDLQWREGLAGMAAHSTLQIEGVDAKQTHLNVKSTLENLNGAALFSGTHEGYSPSYGLSHTRRLYLDHEGEDMRGEEVLTRNVALKPLPILIRFHLHPSVKASMVENRQGVLLRLPNGSGWMFRGQGAQLSLEDSVHCPDGFTIRKTRQIIMTSPMDDLNLQLKWAFKKQ